MNNINLSLHSIGSIPSQYFISEFISKHEEETLIRNIEQAPKVKWTNLSKRSLQNWGGIPGGKSGKSDIMLEEPIPQWLDKHCELFYKHLMITNENNEDIPFFNKKPNHILINKYNPGQGIMPHEDGPIYEPFVAVLNLNSGLLLDIYKRNNDKKLIKQGSVWMEERSLWVMTEELYLQYLHGIDNSNSDIINNDTIIYNYDKCSEKTKEIITNIKNSSVNEIERKVRYSLTFRIVRKSRKIPSNLLSFVTGKKV